MPRTTIEKIENIQSQIEQLENERKRLMQRQKEQERKDRTKRLIECPFSRKNMPFPGLSLRVFYLSVPLPRFLP